MKRNNMLCWRKCIKNYLTVNIMHLHKCKKLKHWLPIVAREIIGAKAAASYSSLLHCLSLGFWIVSLQNSVYIPYLIDRFNLYVCFVLGYWVVSSEENKNMFLIVYKTEDFVCNMNSGEIQRSLEIPLLQ